MGTRMHRHLGVALLLATLGAGTASGQTAATPDQLETLVAPIALYPDSLVANILPASTFPVEIVEAERVLSAGAPTDAQMQGWDPSIQALTSAPSVLKMMNDRLSWTTQLGQAVAQDQGAVMAAVQDVRAKAQAAGNLKSNDRQTVTAQNDTIIIAPANPQVLYVPQYDPVAILAPAPAWGYYPAGYGLLSFGAGFAAGAFVGYGADWGNWHGGYSHVTVNNNYHYNRNTNVNVNTNDVNTARWNPPSNVGHIQAGGSSDGWGSSSSGGAQRTLGNDDRLGGNGFGNDAPRTDDAAARRDDGAGFGDAGHRDDGGAWGGGRAAADASAFHGVGGDGWDTRAASDRGDRSFGGGGFGGGGFGRGGGGFGGGGGGGRGRR